MRRTLGRIARRVRSAVERRLALPQRRFTSGSVRLRLAEGGFRYAARVADLDWTRAVHLNLSETSVACDADPTTVSTRWPDLPTLQMAPERASELLSELARHPLPVYARLRRPDTTVTRLLARGWRHSLLNGDTIDLFIPMVDRDTARVHGSDAATAVIVTADDGRVQPAVSRASHGEAAKPIHGVWSHADSPQWPIDVVYLWVDGGDPQWADRYLARRGELHSGSPPPWLADEVSRFKSRDELRYSLRSLHRHAPWIRDVILVTDHQKPEWLADDALRIVDHTEILPEAALPTFNSHAIMAAIHRIPGLSERFIVMNDDVFLGRPLPHQRLFTSDALTRFFKSAALITGSAPAIGPARSHTAKLVESLTGSRPVHLLKHTPIVLNRDLLESLESELPEEFDRTRSTPFRSEHDLIVELLHHYVGEHRRLTVPSEISYGYFGWGSRAGSKGLKRYQSGPPAEVLCVNDVTGEDSYPVSDGELTSILERQFPYPSPYEDSAS